MKQVLLSSIYRWGNWDTDLMWLPQCPQIVSGGLLFPELWLFFPEGIILNYLVLFHSNLCICHVSWMTFVFFLPSPHPELLIMSHIQEKLEDSRQHFYTVHVQEYSCNCCKLWGKKGSYLSVIKIIRLLNSKPRQFCKEIEYNIFVDNYSHIKKYVWL